MRRPVNEPGPIAIAKAASWRTPTPARRSKRSIAGSSAAAAEASEAAASSSRVSPPRQSAALAALRRALDREQPVLGR